MAHYQRPDALTTRLMNPLIMALTKLGLSVRGSHVLAVRGRKTGKIQEVPVGIDHGVGHFWPLRMTSESSNAPSLRCLGAFASHTGS